MSTAEHREKAKSQSALCAVLTISDTRTEADDGGGKIIREALAAAGHAVKAYRIVKDEPAQIDAALRAWLGDASIHAILCTGGTGIARRDTTIEVVERLLDKKLDGFGELFRMLSWEQVGAAAMLSRAVAGLAGETLIFAMPGSTNAVRLAMEKLIAPELSHLVWERRR
ncbi:MAG: MogA/MoaB family molybdenum cofactor biosynthesis protein [Planctomycetes bacterium]|nr:MogA/MoaB family molybdenum cofactor biosynthesis protein [Planctomycetota bacterium]